MTDGYFDYTFKGNINNAHELAVYKKLEEIHKAWQMLNGSPFNIEKIRQSNLGLVWSDSDRSRLEKLGVLPGSYDKD